MVVSPSLVIQPDVDLQETAVPVKIIRNITLFWLHFFPILKHPLSLQTGL